MSKGIWSNKKSCWDTAITIVFNEYGLHKPQKPMSCLFSIAGALTKRLKDIYGTYNFAF